MKPAKKATRSKKTNKDQSKEISIEGKSEAELRKHFSSLTPMRLRKYAIGGLNIPAEVVDGWNDLDHSVDYCVKKALGQELPEAPDPNSDDEEYENNEEEESVEFDAGDLDDDSNEEEDSDAGSLFADPDEDEEEEETEPDPEPEPPKRRRGRPKKNKKAEEPKNEAGGVEDVITQMLDVITNQGVIIESMQKSIVSLKDTCETMENRQLAHHSALSTLAKTVFSMSTVISGYVPKALKAMRYKPSDMKQIRGQADAAGVEAQELFNSLLDTESDSEED